MPLISRQIISAAAMATGRGVYWCCTEGVHAALFLGALGGIAYGLDQVHRPTAIVVTSGLVLAFVTYARTRPAPPAPHKEDDS